MGAIGRALVVLAMLASTSACTMVASDEPLFDGASSKGAAPLKPGVWSAPTGECPFDQASPVETWPECANGTVVADDGETLFNKKKRKEGDDSPDHLTYRMAAGDPQILQIGAPPGDEPEMPKFLYAGLSPMKTDKGGAVVEARFWILMCARPPMNANDPSIEPAPIPGLPYVKGESFCRVADPALVRKAAKANEAWFREGPDDWFLIGKWVRSGDK